jgi:hypothetical protein
MTARPEAQVTRLLCPDHLFSREEVLARPCPVPTAPGVYAWYFDELPPGVPSKHCHRIGSLVLLYVGISPTAPSIQTGRVSRQNLRTRLRYHYRGNAYGSTLRLTLGALLNEQLNVQLRRVGSGSRLTFAAGEAVLSQWMAEHARVCWTTTNEPWLLEPGSTT